MAVFFNLLARFSDLVNSNICITKIDWTKSNFPSKRDFKCDEKIKKHSLASREEIGKLHHTLLVIIIIT